MQKNKPNVILIYADDLGRGMLSCYGQKWFKTPNIDSLCESGLKFTNAHGCHMCAPARASLMCGVHDSHCGKWRFTNAGIYKDYAKGDLSLEEVYELIHNVGIEERADNMYLPKVFAQKGYKTAQIGKLEWGFATTGDEIKNHGWGYHYGYYDHQMCHGHYPPFLFEDGKRIDIPENEKAGPDCAAQHYSTKTFELNGTDAENGRGRYAQDIFDEKIIEYLRKNKNESFFLYHPTLLPHGNLSIPKIDDLLADNAELNTSEKVFASMVLRLDKTVGLILAELENLGLSENTIVCFTSDNGHFCYYNEQRTGFNRFYDINGNFRDDLNVRFTSEAFADVFNGNDGMTGCKSTNFEGGTNVPLLVKWPNKVEVGSTHALVANYDFMATMAELMGTSQGEGKDGLSYLPLLLGQEQTWKEHDYIVFASAKGPALLTKDGFKIRSYITDNYGFGQFGTSWEDIEGQVVFELYDLKNDYKEEHNIAKENPQKLRELMRLLIRECDGNVSNGTPQAHFAFYGYDYKNEILQKKLNYN